MMPKAPDTTDDISRLLQLADADRAREHPALDAGALVEAARHRQSRATRLRIAVSATLGAAFLCALALFEKSNTSDKLAHGTRHDDAAAAELSQTLTALDREAEHRLRI